MTSLDRNRRRDLENNVKKARRCAEAGARQVLERLAVSQAAPWDALTPEQRKLRNRLRAHGRQLGDRLDEKNSVQTIERLVGECAYEHWHRLLFARFLAENDLLVEPDSGMPLSLDECRELAREKSVDWLVLASEFAQRMLPQIFRNGDPVLDVTLPAEKRQELETILEGMPRDVFVADDSLGWVYQFWQSEEKDRVNKSENKIGAEELPAVTQLFTEDYMVDFLLDNTLGSWHAGKILAGNPKLAESAQSEDELREAAALPKCPWKYLRFVQSEEGRWTPAAGRFDGWPNAAKSLTCLDPCMGSGHFVVAMFERLVSLRMAEEALDVSAAVAGVIRDNLFGLEIDPRCTQIAAFNLALAAWRRVGGHCPLPAMNLACSGLAPNTSREEWLKLTPEDSKLRFPMGALYDLFQKAPVLGSLINPRTNDAINYQTNLDELQPLMEKALGHEFKDDRVNEMAVAARGIVKAAEILNGQYTLVATNVPYLGRAKQDEVLKDYCERSYPSGKADLATCFVQRSLESCAPCGSIALVAPQNWLFLGTYKAMRKTLLLDATWNVVVRLGPKAFKTPMWDFNVLLVGISKKRAPDGHSFFGYDVAELKTAEEKSIALEKENARSSIQAGQLANPDHRISLGDLSQYSLLQEHAKSLIGIMTGDYPRFIRSFWELERHFDAWDFYSRPSNNGIDRSEVILWEKGNGTLLRFVQEKLGVGGEGAWLRGQPCWGNRGVAIQLMGGLTAMQYEGQKFDQTLAVILPKQEKDLPAIWAFTSSPGFAEAVRKIDQKLNLTNATLAKVPFDLAHWQKVADEKYPNGLPKPFSTDPTQWLFNGHPKGSDQPLHVAVARLVGYQWPRQTGSNFPDCPALGPDGLETHADDDGIVCLAAIKGEATAAERLRQLLAAAYGADWSADKLGELLSQADAAGKTLEEWLRHEFFEKHCALFHQRPFVWQVWDGLQNGFSALVNYHKLAAPKGEGRRTLEKLIYTYLGDWIDRQRADQKAGVEGADGRVAAAEHLKRELEKILAGEPPYDIFVRWKPLHEQPIGWDPDINDGVRLNIRPFMTAKLLNARGKTACILRATPKIKWDKDRGKEPTRVKTDFPWFWAWDEETQDFTGGSEFDGNRWNDLHYSRKAKLAAQALVKGAKP